MVFSVSILLAITQNRICEAPVPKPLETPFGNLREFVRRFFVENTCFSYVIITFIALNSLMMGIQADWMVTHVGQQAPVVFDVLEYIFAVIFTWELVMRIFVYNIAFFRMPDWKWNIFDSIVVFLQVFDIITTLAVGGNNGGNLNFMRLVRLMRLLRILRLMRVLRFVQELRSMVMSIAASLRSLMWTIILLAFLMYGVGVCLIQMIADKGLEEPRIMEIAPDIKLYYGSLVEALVSLFAGITGGIDWNDLLVPLEDQIGPWLAAVFVLYIAFAVLAMMNVVTGGGCPGGSDGSDMFRCLKWIDCILVESIRPQASSWSRLCNPQEQMRRRKWGSSLKSSFRSLAVEESLTFWRSNSKMHGSHLQVSLTKMMFKECWCWSWWTCLLGGRLHPCTTILPHHDDSNQRKTSYYFCQICVQSLLDSWRDLQEFVQPPSCSIEVPLYVTPEFTSSYGSSAFEGTWRSPTWWDASKAWVLTSMRQGHTGDILGVWTNSPSESTSCAWKVWCANSFAVRRILSRWFSRHMVSSTCSIRNNQVISSARLGDHGWIAQGVLCSPTSYLPWWN